MPTRASVACFSEAIQAGFRRPAVDKLRKMLAFLQDLETADELHAVSIWKAHRPTGDRKGTWSLHVTRNWRITFCRRR